MFVLQPEFTVLKQVSWQTSALKSLMDILRLGDGNSSVDGLTPDAISSAANMSTLTSPLLHKNKWQHGTNNYTHVRPTVTTRWSMQDAGAASALPM